LSILFSKKLKNGCWLRNLSVFFALLKKGFCEKYKMRLYAKKIPQNGGFL
jgi:hypothetical protein